jgi:hypothetical protein
MNNDLYAWTRFASTPDLNLQTIYNHDETKSFGVNEITDLITSKSNLEYLTNLIIERADPLRNGSSLASSGMIQSRVGRLLESWKNVGKFDRDTIEFEGKRLLVRTVSPIALLDHYNLEFVKTFAESILPLSDVTKVTSVVNPNGLYAQQERIIKINSKPVPFYERSIFRRLSDRNLEQRIDETEMPFYKMDHNPRMTDAERKKRDVDRNQEETYLDREQFSYRMIPRY